jgi:hypothetical protein
MTLPAYSALSQMIRDDLEIFSEQLHGCLKEIQESQCDLVGIVVGNDHMAMAFIADRLEIRDMEQRVSALKEFPAARFYVCREGRAERRDRGEFLQAMWLRVIENAGKKAR